LGGIVVVVLFHVTIHGFVLVRVRILFVVGVIAVLVVGVSVTRGGFELLSSRVGVRTTLVTCKTPHSQQ
jgi:hypothetical protein